MFKNPCLACGHHKKDYRSLITMAYVAGTWLFAILLVYLILQIS